MRPRIQNLVLPKQKQQQQWKERKEEGRKKGKKGSKKGRTSGIACLSYWKQFPSFNKFDKNLGRWEAGDSGEHS
jgi:hypothetical protein